MSSIVPPRQVQFKGTGCCCAQYGGFATSMISVSYPLRQTSKLILSAQAFILSSCPFRLYMRRGTPRDFASWSPRFNANDVPQPRGAWARGRPEMVRRERKNRPTPPPVKPGEILKGKVTALQPYGAFVDIGHYRKGLIHVSEISSDFVRDVGKYLSVGQEVDVKVMKVEDHRISLSMKAVRDRRGTYPPDVEARYDRLVSLGGDWGHPWNDDGKTKWVNFGTGMVETEEENVVGEDDVETCLPENIGKSDIRWAPGIKHFDMEVHVLPVRGSQRLGKPLEQKRTVYRLGEDSNDAVDDSAGDEVPKT